MQGHEVNHLLLPDSNITQNEGRDASYLNLKCQVYALAFQNLETSFMEDYNSEEQYGFRPFPSGRFVDLLIEASKFAQFDKNRSFLEIGCGPGFKLSLAKFFHDVVHGIEIVPEYVDFAHKMLGHDVQLQDAMEFDRYGEYDLLYYYRPFADNEMQSDFEHKICEAMKQGAYLAPMHTQIDMDVKLQRISRYLYQKR